MFGLIPHEKMLDRIHALAKERLTTKREDLVRSVYPLFGMKWPGASFTLEEAQQALLEHLGDEAPRCHPLHGPIMPRPWSWAPLTIAGCSGGVAGPGMLVTPHGLRGEWAAWQIEFIRGVQMPDAQRSTGHNSRLACLTGTKYDTALFKVEGVSKDFVAQVFHREDNLSRLSNCTLLLLRAFNSGQVMMGLMDYYHIVEVEGEVSNGEKLMHRVGSCLGGLMGQTESLIVQEPKLRGWME